MGRLESTGQVVAVKQLDRNGLQGNREFLVEVLMLSLLHHPNLVNLIGYCADGDQRLLVYEYMALGCLEDHLHYLPPDKEPLDWNARMKIAAGAAKGLEYLHDKANPPVIYRDFKSSNILLSEGFHPKLSDFGLAKLGPIGDKTHVSTRVMGTYGYCAPEYALTGQLTVKSDVYSFGVVLLELITGRKAIDNSHGAAEHNLVSWAQPLFKDRKKFYLMADPLLCGRYPLRGLYQAIAVAAMCLQDDAATRPVIGDVVTALNYLASQHYDPKIHPINKVPPSISRDRKEKDRKLNNGDKHGMDEKGVAERLVGQGATKSPASNSQENQNRVVRQVMAYQSSDNVIQDSAMRNQDTDGWVKFSGQKDSSRQGIPGLKSISDRERAVAEARVWGENWREKKRGTVRNTDLNLNAVVL
ncbi:hypothetical protein KP509_26G060500 [Ceratopteris richardii]|nr:hypothetical protein KP509_26G060500 [Ceratopteris richardii]